MGIRKDIKLIKEKVEKITNETIYKAEQYSFLKENLEKISIEIDDIKTFIDDYGKVGIKVKYKIPEISIILDDNNDIIKNELFYAVNVLKLLPVSDEQKLINAIKKIQNINNQM